MVLDCMLVRNKGMSTNHKDNKVPRNKNGFSVQGCDEGRMDK